MMSLLLQQKVRADYLRNAIHRNSDVCIHERHGNSQARHPASWIVS